MILDPQLHDPVAPDGPQGIDGDGTDTRPVTLSGGIHTEYPCQEQNYRKGRQSPVSYLVIHYVGATGSAQSNAAYFHTHHAQSLGASAHYFVGHAAEGGAVYQSVPEGDTAWHCGAATYRHAVCRNANSIGVELCCHRDSSGAWYFDPETIAAAVALCQDLMRRYRIPLSNVLRHYDVTGKVCPAPFVKDAAAWQAFLQRL